MICIISQHFSLNRILLLAIGLWPYQKSKLVWLQEILFFSILLSFVIFQVRNLLEQLQYICNDLKDENEIDIIIKMFRQHTVQYDGLPAHRSARPIMQEYRSFAYIFDEVY